MSSPVGSPCLVDADCPDNQVCYLANSTWVETSQCVCNVYYGWSGDTCTRILQEPNGVFLLVDGIIGVLVSIVFAWVSWHNVYHLYRVSDGRPSSLKEPVFISSLYFSLASLLFIVYCSLVIAFPLVPLSSTAPNDEALLYLEYVAQTVLTVALMFVAFGVVTISMGFIAMTEVLSAKRRQRIRYLEILYKASFAIVILSLVASRHIHLALFVAIPYIVLLAVTHVIGLTLLTRKIRQHHARDRTGKVNVALNSLRSAQRTIVFLSIALVLEIVLGIIWGVSSLIVGWKSVTRPGELSPTVTGALLWFPAILAAAAVMKDITSWRRVRVARQSQLGSSMSSLRGPPRNKPFKPSKRGKQKDQYSRMREHQLMRLSQPKTLGPPNHENASPQAGEEDWHQATPNISPKPMVDHHTANIPDNGSDYYEFGREVATV